MLDAGGILQKLNEEAKQIFSLTREKGPLAKSDLVRFTGMKLTTLNRSMEQLLAAGLLEECGIGESSGGRKPSLYSVNAKRYAVVGIDISRTYTRVVITDLGMNVRFMKHFDMDESFGPVKVVECIAGIVNDGLAALALEKESLLGVGIGTVGPLDRHEGKIINPVNFPAPDWKDVPIKHMLEEKLGCAVSIDNGANTSVLAEYLFGSGKGYDSISYFNCGVGIRTGAISSGVIVRTINDTEDAFGHMVVDVDGEPCSCGNYGCIECYATIPSIVGKFISAIKKGRGTTVSRELGQITYLDICNAASQGDALANEVIVGAANIFGAGLANYLNLFGPGLVILRGPLISHSELFYRTCIEIALRKYYSKDVHSVNFSMGGSFGDNAISVGAAAMVIEKLLGSRIVNTR